MRFVLLRGVAAAEISLYVISFLLSSMIYLFIILL